MNTPEVFRPWLRWMISSGNDKYMTNNTINNEVTMGGAEATLLAGRYRVVKQLGQGGMGSVWLAEDTKLDGHA